MSNSGCASPGSSEAPTVVQDAAAAVAAAAVGTTVKPRSFPDGRVHIDARFILVGEDRARQDPSGYGKKWLKGIEVAAKQAGLHFVDACDKTEMIAAAAANGGKCASICIGGSGYSTPKPPFTDNFAIAASITNDLCGDTEKAESDPHGVVGTPIKVLVAAGVDSFWAQVLYSNCYPRANLVDANVKRDVPLLKDVMFALGHEVPHYANLVDAEQYKECLDAMQVAQEETGDKPPPEYDAIQIIDKVVYLSGREYRLHGLVAKPELNGELVAVASRSVWRKNAAERVGRVPVVLDRTDSIIFVKPANLGPSKAPPPAPPPLSMYEQDQLAEEAMMAAHAKRVEAQSPSVGAQSPSVEALLKVAAGSGKVFACDLCGAHRPLGYRCCGRYAGTQGQPAVPRRNVHEHPEADEDEVMAFLEASLKRLDAEEKEGGKGE